MSYTVGHIKLYNNFCLSIMNGANIYFVEQHVVTKVVAQFTKGDKWFAVEVRMDHGLCGSFQEG